MELPGEVDLTLPDLRPFADVERVRHQFEVRQDEIERGSDGARNDVIDFEPLSGIGAALHDGRGAWLAINRQRRREGQGRKRMTNAPAGTYWHSQATITTRAKSPKWEAKKRLLSCPIWPPSIASSRTPRILKPLL
jgi:hypothetical protein